MKRTTLILEDGCMDGVREIAREEDRPLSEVVNELLAEEGMIQIESTGAPAIPISDVLIDQSICASFRVFLPVFPRHCLCYSLATTGSMKV